MNFMQIMEKAESGETEAVLEACRNHQGLVLRADDENGWRLLHRVCSRGHLELACGLLDLGASVNARDNSGWDALLCASDGDHPAVVTLLLDRGADPCSRSKDYSALHLAAYNNNLQVCLSLLNRGADLLALTVSQRNALQEYGKGAFPRITDEEKEQCRNLLRAAWVAGPHPSQRWVRRFPLMNVLTGCGYLPLAARRLQLEMDRLVLGSEAPPPEPLETPAKLHAYLLGQVFSNAGLMRAVASFL